MTKYMLSILLFIAAVFCAAALAEPVNCNNAQGTVAIPGTALTVNCPSSTVPPPQPPPVQPPSTGCDASQLSSAVGGKRLKRQCAVSMTVWPNGASYGGDATDLGKVLNGSSFPAFAYAGYSPTFTVNSGSYIALAFTPKAQGAFQLAANPSYGDGGTISLSTVPGALTRDAAGAICVLNRGSNNSLYVSTIAGSICQVQAGTTYFVNISDVDTLGNNLCFKGMPNTCASSTLSYTVYTSGR